MVALPEIKKKLEEVFPPHQAQVLVEMVELANTLVKASDLAELKQVVQELAEAQKRGETRLERLEAVVGELAEAQKLTEQRMGELAEAQKESEARLSRVEAVVGELTEAQKETQKEVGRLDRALQELADAQKRTEQRMGELAEAQKASEARLSRVEAVVGELAEAQKETQKEVGRLDRALQELAEAQQRTEQALEKLAAEHLETRRQLGGLAMTVGYTLENEAYKALPELLERDHGLLVEGRLKRTHVPLGNGDYLEVNILGEGTVAGRKVKIVGESKAQLSKNDVDRFIRRKLNKLKDAFPDIFPVLVTHMTTSPDVEDYARAKGIALYYSYEF